MIQPLRTVHRRAFVALGLVLPAILVVGQALRHPPSPVNGSSDRIPDGQFVMKKSDRMWQKHAMVTEFYGDAKDATASYVVLRPAQDLNEPDLLLYWTEVAVEGNTLPRDARLLGAFAPGKIFLLNANGQRSGRLVLYSGAHQTIVDTSLVESLP
jgi:hypothetical protein